MLLFSSMSKLGGMPGWEDSFLVWGYTKSFMIVVGIIELALSIMIFVPKTRKPGLIGLVILMIGALFTHITNDQYEEIYTAVFLLVLASCSFALMFLQDSAKK